MRPSWVIQKGPKSKDKTQKRRGHRHRGKGLEWGDAVTGQGLPGGTGSWETVKDRFSSGTSGGRAACLCLGFGVLAYRILRR